MTMVLLRCPWGEESLLREDTDESLWFFGPAGENNYRVAGVRLDCNISPKQVGKTFTFPGKGD